MWPGKEWSPHQRGERGELWVHYVQGVNIGTEYWNWPFEGEAYHIGGILGEVRVAHTGNHTLEPTTVNCYQITWQSQFLKLDSTDLLVWILQWKSDSSIYLSLILALAWPINSISFLELTLIVQSRDGTTQSVTSLQLLISKILIGRSLANAKKEIKHWEIPWNFYRQTAGTPTGSRLGLRYRIWSIGSC